MKKTQNILTGIIIIAIIALIGIVIWIVYNQMTNSQKQEVTSTNSTTTNKTSNTTEEEVNEEKNTTLQSNDDYIGIEEEESSKEENTEKTTDERAIELAKETWGEDDSVTFSIERKDDNIYYIAVRSNATTISWYKVNTETWEISEYY